MVGNMECPRKEKRGCKRKLKPLLEGSSWVCYEARCNNNIDLEFYRRPNGELLTGKEFKELQREYNG